MSRYFVARVVIDVEPHGAHHDDEAWTLSISDSIGGDLENRQEREEMVEQLLNRLGRQLKGALTPIAEER